MLRDIMDIHRARELTKEQVAAEPAFDKVSDRVFEKAYGVYQHANLLNDPKYRPKVPTTQIHSFLLLRYLFLQQQITSYAFNMKRVVAIAMGVSMLLLAGSLAVDQLRHEGEGYVLLRKSWKYWVYTGLLFVFNMAFYAMNTAFLEITYIDILRRKRMQKAIIAMLEPDYRKRKLRDLALPAINFCDPMSMATLLQTRRLILEVGARFSFRIQLYVLIYSLFIGLFSALFILDLLGLIRFENPMLALTMIIFWVVFAIYGLSILAPAAYFNWDVVRMTQKLIDLQYVLKTMHESEIVSRDSLSANSTIP